MSGWIGLLWLIVEWGEGGHFELKLMLILALDRLSDQNVPLDPYLITYRNVDAIIVGCIDLALSTTWH